MIILLSLGLIILNWILSPPVVLKVLAKGFTEKELYLSMELMRLGLPMILFILIRSVFVAFFYKVIMVLRRGG